MIQDFNSVVEQMKLHGMYAGKEEINLEVPNAKTILMSAMEFFVKPEGKPLVWKPEYDRVADWLSNNRGRGLLMYGDCGLGKSILGTRAIPAILLKYCNKVVRVYSATEMNQQADEILKRKIVSIDDIGTEGIYNSYGNRRLVFDEVMDTAEKTGTLVIISSNLNAEQLTEKYGYRVFDRIVATTYRVPFNGKSLRT